jgi:hypothetical protein
MSYKINKRSVKAINDYIPILLIVFITANVASILHDRVFVIALFFITGLVFFLKGKKLNKVFLLIAIVWLIINILSFFYNQTADSFVRGTSIKSSFFALFTSYFLIVLSGRLFFVRLEKIIFFLTIVSFPFYIAEWILPSVMNSITSPIDCLRGDSGSWYIGVYYHLWGFTGSTADSRNSGFMWEPGAFAFMIILGVIINFRNNGIGYSKKLMIYGIAMATTLSTMGYMVGFIIIGLLIRRLNIFVSMVVLIVFFFTIPMIIQLDFIEPEIEKHFEQGNSQIVNRNERVGVLRINRYAAMLLAIDETRRWPFGYGIIESKNILGQFGEVIYGVGAFQYVLIKWGVIGFIFMIVSIKRSIMIMGNYSIDKNSIWILQITILMGLFSNPLETSPIFYALVFFPFLFGRGTKPESTKIENLSNI